MDAAAEVLTVYGVLSLVYGFLLGVPISAIRMRAAQAPRHLMTAHLAAIIQGAMLLALTAAVNFSTLPSRVEVLGASLLVGGCILFVFGATMNWLQRVGDHFAERSLGWRLLATSAPLNVTGIIIFAVGVVRAATI